MIKQQIFTAALVIASFLVLAYSVQAGSITQVNQVTNSSDPVVFTEIDFNITDPPGTTVTGFTLAYQNSISSISNLTLLSGPVSMLTSDNVNVVIGSFNQPITQGDIKYIFTSTGSFPIGNLNLNLTGDSQTITGGTATITVQPVSSVSALSSIFIFGSGLIGVMMIGRYSMLSYRLQS
jgi:hypothetical protein